jgi:hypothetical protein
MGHPIKRKKNKVLLENAARECRFTSADGRHCHRRREGYLCVCSVHRAHDFKYIAKDLSIAVRRMERTRSPDEVSKKLATLRLHGRIPVQIADMMVYTAQVMAVYGDPQHIELWSRLIAQAALPPSERDPSLSLPRLQELNNQSLPNPAQKS